MLFWTAVFAVWVVSRSDMRPALLNVLRSFAEPLIYGPILALTAYTAGLVWLGHLVGIWQADMVKETALWFFGVGLALLMNLSRVLDRDDWFQVEARRALRATVLIDFFINLAVLPLPLELILVPLLTVLLLMSIVGDGGQELGQAKSCINGLLNRTKGTKRAKYWCVRSSRPRLKDAAVGTFEQRRAHEPTEEIADLAPMTAPGAAATITSTSCGWGAPAWPTWLLAPARIASVSPGRTRPSTSPVSRKRTTAKPTTP